jgi:YfiR/HmsC-like
MPSLFRFPLRLVHAGFRWCMPLLLATGISVSFAAPVSSLEQLTLVYLYNFFKYTEWPTSNDSGELTLCITENAKFGAELQELSGRAAQNKKVVIKRVGIGENPGACHLLFLSREEGGLRIREWLKLALNLPILLVSDSADFLDIGGMVVLIEDNNRLQFAVNLETVRNVGLKMDAQLLRIAKDVRGK